MDLYEVRAMLASGKSIYEIPLRAAYYARVSTEKDGQLHSLAAQKEYFEQLIQNTPDWSFAGGYIDEGISGTKTEKRESFLRMINDAKNSAFDLIVTKEISRFSRSTLDSIFYTQELLHCGVGVMFRNDNICTLDADAELRLTIMASIAQDEVRKLSERCRFGFKRSIEKGTVLGNDKIWGYHKDNGKLIILPEEANIVKRIFEMYVYDGFGIRRIANALTEQGYTNTNSNPFSFSTVKGILTNPKYKGYYCGNKTHKLDYRSNDRKAVPPSEWVMYKDTEAVPPIVSEEVWNRANEILKGKSRKTTYSASNRYKYSGKIICEKHRCTYQRTAYKHNNTYTELWQCSEYTAKGKKGCSLPTLYTSELDTVIMPVYKALLERNNSIVDDIIALYRKICIGSGKTHSTESIRQKINILLARKDKLLDLTLSGKLSDEEFGSQNLRFNQRLDELNAELKQTEYRKADAGKTFTDIDALRHEIASMLESGECINNSVIDSFIEKITVSAASTENEIRLQVLLKKLADSPPIHSNSVSASLQRGTRGKSAKKREIKYTAEICMQT